MKHYKPITPSLRHRVVIDHKYLSNKKSIKNLSKIKQKNSGRNNQGLITVRHKGGGNKTKYRKVDFLNNIYNIPGKIINIEYDPNRTNYINRINYLNFVTRYRPSFVKKKISELILNCNNICYIDTLNQNSIGLRVQLKYLPNYTKISNIELYNNKGSQLIRSAGTYATLLNNNNPKYSLIKLSSGEYRLISSINYATIGINDNIDNNKKVLGKAGANRWIGKRPTVRGVAMNPIDHPHGGGEGKTSGGRPSVTPWGKITKGKKTRSKKKINKLIIKYNK